MISCIELSKEELTKLQLAIIVESWDKLNNRKRKEFNKLFTEAERKLIHNYYKRAYRWYLVKGYPNNYRMRSTTLPLLKRAVNYFATL